LTSQQVKQLRSLAADRRNSVAEICETLGALCELVYAARSLRQTRSRVCAAMVAAVRVSRPQKVCAP